MFKLYIIIFLLFAFNFKIHAQGWVKVYDIGWWGGNFFRDSSKNFIIYAGGLIVKINNEGELLWVEAPSNYRSNNFYYTPNNESLLLQTNLSDFPKKAAVTLLDTDKEIQWEYQLLDFPFHENSQFSQSHARDAVQNEEGDYFVFGDSFKHATLSPVEGYDFHVPFLIKLNAQGERQWLHTYCNTLPPLDYGMQKSFAIENSGDGGFVLMTIVDDGSATQYQYPGFTKVNSAGEMLWKQYLYYKLIIPQYNGVEYIIQYPSDNMVITAAGEIVTAGMSRPKGEYIGIPYLMTLNPDGSLQSFLPLDIPFNQEYLYNIEIQDIQQYGENYVLLYNGRIINNLRIIGLAVIDKMGNTLLNKVYDNMNTTITGTRAESIMVLEEGGFAIVGGGLDLTLIKTDSLGNCYPNTQFDATDTGLGLYQFDNQSENADSYFWEFGDSSTDTTAMTFHQYQAIGVYEVCLTATNLCDSFKKCENIEVAEVTDIEAYEWEQGLLVYPNPVHNTPLFVDIPQINEPPTLTLYNSLGQQLSLPQSANALDTSALKVGVYYLQIEVGRETTVRKIVVY